MPSGPLRLSDEQCRAIADGTDELIVVFDLNGTIEYVNDIVFTALGGGPADYLGRNVVDFVHPEERDRALQTLAFSADFGAIPGITSFRLRTTDGGHEPIELTTGVIDTSQPMRFVLGRVITHQVAVQHTLHSLATDDDIAAAMRSALDTVGWQRMGSRVGVVWRDRTGEDQAVTTGLADALAGAHASPGSVWDEVRRTGHAVTSSDLTDLDASSRALAEAADLGGYWIESIDAPGTDALLSVWTPAGGMPPALHAYGMELAANLIAIILRWDDQRRRLDDLASRDALTGLANRRLFFDALSSAGPGAILYCDLDEFKPVNDEFGHPVGDGLLQVVAERLRSSVRDGDLVARLGGDEFAVICPGATLDEAAHIAARVTASVSAPAEVMGTRVQVGITIGTAHQEYDLDESAVEAADRKLNDSKSARRRRRTD